MFQNIVLQNESTCISNNINLITEFVSFQQIAIKITFIRFINQARNKCWLHIMPSAVPDFSPGIMYS